MSSTQPHYLLLGPKLLIAHSFYLVAFEVQWKITLVHCAFRKITLMTSEVNSSMPSFLCHLAISTPYFNFHGCCISKFQRSSSVSGRLTHTGPLIGLQMLSQSSGGMVLQKHEQNSFSGCGLTGVRVYRVS